MEDGLGNSGENAHADNADLLAWPNAVADERGVGGQAGAEHRGGELGLEAVGDGEGEVLKRADVGGVAAVGECAVGVEGVVCVCYQPLSVSVSTGSMGSESLPTLLLLAVRLVVLLALRAVQAGRDLRTNADAVANLDGRHLGADLDGRSDDFMAGNDGVVLVAPAARHGVEVGAADAAACDLDIDVVVAKRLGLELCWKRWSVPVHSATRWYMTREPGGSGAQGLGVQ